MQDICPAFERLQKKMKRNTLLNNPSVLVVSFHWLLILPSLDRNMSYHVLWGSLMRKGFPHFHYFWVFVSHQLGKIWQHLFFANSNELSLSQNELSFHWWGAMWLVKQTGWVHTRDGWFRVSTGLIRATFIRFGVCATDSTLSFAIYETLNILKRFSNSVIGSLQNGKQLCTEKWLKQTHSDESFPKIPTPSETRWCFPMMTF